MEKTFLNPEELPDWSDIFSQVVTVEANGVKTIYVAGQVAVDRDRNIVGKGDLEEQTRQTLRNLQTALAAAGATLADAVKVDIYVKNYQPENAGVIRKVYGQFFGQQRLPVSNWIGVQSLAIEDFLIEIDATAVVVV
jgi:enamine deaminase RidA (YjgF/YER057c/UK114 family)